MTGSGPKAPDKQTEAGHKELAKAQHRGRARPSADLDRLVKVTRAPLWIALIIIVVLFCGFIAWGMFAEILISSSGNGMTVGSGEERPVKAPGDGVISSIKVTSAQNVTDGSPIADIKDKDGTETTVTANLTEHIGSVKVGAGLTVKQGEPLTTIYDASEPMQVFAYVPLSQTTPIAPGMSAWVRGSSETTDTAGYANGVVAAVSSFPASAEQVEEATGSAAFAESVTQDNAQVKQIAIALEQDGASSDGNAYSDNAAQSAPLMPGVVVDVQIVTSWSHPITYVMP